MNTIISSHNPLIKEVKQLKDRKHREKNKQFFIEGIRFVEEALNEDIEIQRVFVSESLNEANGGFELFSKIDRKGLEVFTLSDKLFKEISDTENPQGVLAVLKAKDYCLNQIITDNNFIIILDSIQDPGNLGTIIRTADAAGASAVILLKGCVDVYNPKVLRATMGSIFHIPVWNCENSIELFEALKNRKIKTYATHLNGTISCFEADMKSNIAILIGNEANGLSEEAVAKADAKLLIPMPGKAESLNASVAAGILMFEVVRQRLNK